MLGLLILLLIAAALLILLMTAMLVHGVLHPPQHTDAYAMARGLPTDPGDLDLRYEQWMLDLPDGAMLPVWEIDLRDDADAVDDQPTDQLLTAVCVHGWGQSNIDLLARLDLLRHAAHIGRIVLYDMRGHGAAEGATASLAAQDHRDLLELLKRLPAGPIVMVGFSMGAIIALRAAAEDEAKQFDLRGVIGIGAYTDFHRALRNQLMRRGYPARPMSDLAMLWLKWLGRVTPPPQDYAPAVSVPVVLLHGRDDHVATVEEAQELAKMLRDCHLHVLEQAGHLDAHERMPEQVVEHIRRFCDHILAGTLAAQHKQHDASASAR